jgi:hypothetical protein
MTVQKLIDELSIIKDKQQDLNCIMTFYENNSKHYDVYSINGIIFLDNEKKFFLEIFD